MKLDRNRHFCILQFIHDSWLLHSCFQIIRHSIKYHIYIVRILGNTVEWIQALESSKYYASTNIPLLLKGYYHFKKKIYKNTNTWILQFYCYWDYDITGTNLFSVYDHLLP